jgi:periplasmic protein TonB
MFEDAIFESTGSIHTGSRRWMMATFALNGTVLLTLVLIPLIYPEVLPERARMMLLTAPPVPPTPPPVTTEVLHPLQGTSIFSAPVMAAPILQRSGLTADNPSIIADGPISMNTGTAMPDAATGIMTGPGVRVVHPDVKGPVHVSTGVMEGSIIRKTVPVYPAIARAAGVQGVVVLQATVSKNGTVENLRVESGPAMLQQAAVEAVKQWRYKPFLLNGEPVEVETTVNVVFSLGR